MRNWDVYFTATKISKGLELDFFENPVTSDDRKLTRLDVLNFEITLRRSRFDGMVTDVRPNGDVIIMAQNTRWRISPPVEGEKVHPVTMKATPHIWIVREELG